MCAERRGHARARLSVRSGPLSVGVTVRSHRVKARPGSPCLGSGTKHTDVTPDGRLRRPASKATFEIDELQRGLTTLTRASAVRWTVVMQCLVAGFMVTMGWTLTATWPADIGPRFADEQPKGDLFQGRFPRTRWGQSFGCALGHRHHPLHQK